MTICVVDVDHITVIVEEREIVERHGVFIRSTDLSQKNGTLIVIEDFLDRDGFDLCDFMCAE